MQLRPRLFLEGNLFVDLHPGSPGAPELDSGSVIPATQTSISVQLDQVLTTLQAPVRDDLQIFLMEFGNALEQVRRRRQGFQESFRTSPGGLRLHVSGQRGSARHPAWRPRRVHRRTSTSSSGRSTERARSSRTWSPTSASSRGAFAANEAVASSRRSSSCPAAARGGRPALVHLNAATSRRCAPSRARLCPASAANQALDDANPFDRPAPPAGLPDRAARPGQRPAARRSRPRRLTNDTLPFLEQARALSSLLQQRGHPVEQHVPFPTTDSDRAGRQGLPGDRLRADGCRGREPLRRRQRPVVPRPRRRRRRTRSPRSPPRTSPSATGVAPSRSSASQPAKQSSAKTPFRPDVAVRDPGSAEPRRRCARARPAQSSAARSAASPRARRRYQPLRRHPQRARQATQLPGPGAARGKQIRTRSSSSQLEQGLAAFQRANGIKLRPAAPARGAALMREAIREHLRDFLAILGLLPSALLVDLHHRPAAAAADPAPRGEAVRAQG